MEKYLPEMELLAPHSLIAHSMKVVTTLIRIVLRGPFIAQAELYRYYDMR